ncbi:MAG: hypothetical protein FWD55_01465 [Propionibacteriaceae bacterium]|nr:hypothetical protein [Propionibacteriaceae bacterium]
MTMNLNDFATASQLVGDLTCSPATLTRIAQYHPSLRKLVATHPNTDPAIFDWLAALGDTELTRIIAERRSQPQTSLAPGAPALPEFVEHTTMSTGHRDG